MLKFRAFFPIFFILFYFFFIKHFFELRVFRILITKQSESLSIQGIVKSIENYYIYIQINVRFIIIRVRFLGREGKKNCIFFHFSLLLSRKDIQNGYLVCTGSLWM